MPGILPMKVIKVGTSAQTRIAQACDRCRSKKIRCDGFRPTCTQCANVGFECKTSDKLSRRAFPRGYTESLEERVRALETEVRELKDLLDEKDEKIEILSKMHSYSPRSISSRRPSSIHSNQEQGQVQGPVDQEKDIRFKLQQTPYLIYGDNTDLYFVGNSSSRAFFIAFRRKLQESGKGNCDFNVDALCTQSPKPSLPTLLPTNESAFWSPPSRMHSDQMVNIFFQEWAPLFPVLHRLTFLTLYEQYVANASNIQDKKSLAQLNLVFGIASLSSESRVIHSADLCERQWTTALDSFIKETSLVTLQCLILAQIYFIQKGEPEKVLQYKGFAIAISHRLGLHLSQKRFALGILTVETRKKVFWSLYAVDCFSAAMLGLPKMLHEEDIFCEYPQDADDEYVTEKGFQPSLPGEATKLSSALALFRGCRILGKVLNQNYPAASSHELSLNTIAALNDELEEWSSGLPSHLKLTFVQDKPSTNTISSRSPLLSLTYNFIRTLIHRPVVSANLGDRASSSVVALAGAHKQIVQIIQLLDERNLCFSHCLNKNEILLTSGIGLLFQSLELDRDGKMMKDSQRLICQVITLLDTRNAPGSAEFNQLGCSMLALPMMSPPPIAKGQASSASKRSKCAITPATTDRHDSHQHIAQLAASYSHYTASHPGPKEKVPRGSRKSASSITESLGQQTIPRPSDKSLRLLAPSLPSHCPSHTSLSTPAIEVTRHTTLKPKHSQSLATNVARTNLDYFSFSEAPGSSNKSSRKPAVDDAQWQSMLEIFESESIDKSSSNSVYEWLPMETLLSPTTVEDSSGVVRSVSPRPDDWSPGLWFDDETANIPHSVLSFSDESLTSGEEFSSVEYGSTRSDSGFRTISIAQPHGAFTPKKTGDVDNLQQEVGV